RTPYEAIETVCHTNRTLAMMFIQQTAAELEPFGKADDWLAALDMEDWKRFDAIVSSCIGRERINELKLGTRKQLREELGIPELDLETRAAARHSWPDPDEEDSQPANPELAEPATVAIAPWRFEEYFSLSGPGHWIALDAFRESVIATPYEAVEMICNVNLMHTLRFRQLMAQAVLEQFTTAEELGDAMRNGTFKERVSAQTETEWFHEKSENLMREIRTRFGVPEPQVRGKAEKYKLWSETRLQPVN
ncbi:MAG TPA: hypothetical protein VHU44_09515, partial [Acidobacteriaceae bacterium]|nr:hypothetical protein [Acidobacteriaceae bacterium]